MDICFEGIGQVVATFATEEKLTPGMAVTMTGNGAVGLSKDSKPVCGVTVSAARGGAVAVQIGGVVKVDCSSRENINVGYVALACDEKGGVKAADGTDGVKCLVLAVDEVESEDKGENGDGDKNKKSVVIKL